MQARAWACGQGGGGGDGLGAIDDAELVAALVGSAGRGRSAALRLAEHLLDRAGGLEGIGRIGPAALCELGGVSPARALRLAACAEMGRRLRERAAQPLPSLAMPAQVAAFLGARIGALDHEQMWVLSLDGRSRLRGMRCVARGGQHGCAVGAREILRAALADAASGFVLGHNHPSGEVTPSPEDVAMTRKVARAAEVVGCPLLDHIIVTAAGQYASLLELGLL
ncbi:MAG: DNA repair protein RadC [Deltaproteobacteria bacterium]|nr:DNA repair protein RadC [Deltaproteobacteria bacterium]